LRPFGWHGIEIEVPESWELARYGAGYASLDDGAALRLHVRWNHARYSPKLMANALRRYERSLRKAAKGKLRFEATDAGALAQPQREDQGAVAYEWASDTAAMGLAWHSQATGRLILIEVLFPGRRAEKALARRILRSARDRREDGRRLWAVYGFAFLAPGHYNLHRPELAPGRLRFELRADSNAWLRVERWAMASHGLGRAPLEDWPRELIAPLRLTPRGRLEREEATVGTHAACRFSQALGRGRLGRRQDLAGLVWACPEDDKIFVVMAAGGDADLPEEVAATVACA